MDDFTSAILNVQGKFRPVPKFIFNAVVPKVWMVVPFVASNVLLFIEVLWVDVGGITFFSSPVSTKNILFDFKSWM